MYGVYTYIYHKNQPNVGKYTIHGSYGNKVNLLSSYDHEFPAGHPNDVTHTFPDVTHDHSLGQHNF